LWLGLFTQDEIGTSSAYSERTRLAAKFAEARKGWLERLLEMKRRK
jgi:hypothetical protein